jgi:hypothetical protein
MIEFLTFLLVVITAVYAYLTSRILEANRRSVTAMQEQMRSATRPHVHLDLVPESRLIEASLRNTGVTAAEPPLRVATRNETRPSRLTAGSMPLLGPGREFREFVGSWEALQSTTDSLVFSATVAYADPAGNRYEESFASTYLVFAICRTLDGRTLGAN